MELLKHAFDQSFYRLFDKKKNLISLPFDENGIILERDRYQNVWIDPVAIDMSKWKVNNNE